jgi:hypothetical protein
MDIDETLDRLRDVRQKQANSLVKVESKLAAKNQTLQSIIDLQNTDCSYHDKYILACVLAKKSLREE